MESIIILKTVFIFIVLWGLAAAFLIFRPRVSFIWKIAAIMLYAFYVWYFREDIMSGYGSFTQDWFGTLILFAKEIMFLMFYLLFVFWPISLVIIFYKADDLGAQNLLKFMVIYTLIVWVIITIYAFNKKVIDSTLYETLTGWIPFIQ